MVYPLSSCSLGIPPAFGFDIELNIAFIHLRGSRPAVIPTVVPDWPKSALAVPVLAVPGDPELVSTSGSGTDVGIPESNAELTGTGSSSSSSETADVCVVSTRLVCLLVFICLHSLFTISVMRTMEKYIHVLL